MENGISLGPFLFLSVAAWIALLLWIVSWEDKRLAEKESAEVAKRRHHLLVRAYRVLELHCPNDPLVDDIEEELDREFVSGRA